MSIYDNKANEGMASFVAVEKKSIKKRAAAFCMCAMLIGGALGAICTYGFYSRNASQTADKSYSAYYGEAVQTKYSQLASQDGARLSASEIYADNVDKVAAISTESSVMNVFGQMSSTASSGTGFIISDDGYILTCYHVVENARQINVSTYDGNKYEAELIGFDDENDIAVLKINASGLPYVSIGDSANLIVGEDVFVIGNPLGEFTYTLTRGIVSALDREVNIDGDSINMFQLDAAVNSGNSGGPVFNSYGQVIGIVTAKTAASGVEGIGFAVPVCDVTDSVNQIIQKGYVSGRPYIGISVQNASAVRIIQNGMSVAAANEGVYVVSVEEQSCAQKAGIKTGDIIVQIGDSKISSYSDLQTVKKSFRAGDTAKFTIYRNGKTITLNVTFDEKTAGKK